MAWVSDTAPASKIPGRFARWLKRYNAPFAGYAFISPWLIGFLFLTAYPMGMSLYYAMSDYDLLSAPEWVGMQNFDAIFEDRYFYKSISVTFLYVIWSVPLRLIAALLVALLLAQKLRGISAYRTAIYLPSLIGASIAVAVLWRNIFGLEGFVNSIVSMLGFLPKNWIGMPDTAMGTLVLLSVWQFGSAMIIFLAGLKQIPQELYEAASVDGASRVRKFFSITLPMLSPVILFNVVMGTISAFQMFTQSFIITNGGPMRSTYVYAVYLYETAFVEFRMGYASALAWILLTIVAAMTLLNFVVSKYWVFYENEEGKS